jgi:hypothetical protein
MFQNAFQSGASVEVLYSCDKSPGWSINKSNWKFYDKAVKGYVILVDSNNTKLQIPGSDKQTLALVQPFLVLQIFILPAQPFTLEIATTDISNTKRRIVFSSASKDMTVNPMHARVPNSAFVRGTWANISIDISRCMLACFGHSTFRSLDSISISCFCKVRRVFTMRAALMDTTDSNVRTDISEIIPKNLDFPGGVSYTNQLITPEILFPNVETKEVKLTPKKPETRAPLPTAPLEKLKRTGLRTSSVNKKQGNTTTTFFQRKQNGALSPRGKDVKPPAPVVPKAEPRIGTAGSNRYGNIEEEKETKEEEFSENPLEDDCEEESKNHDFLHLTNYRNAEDVLSNSIEEEIEVDPSPGELQDFPAEIFTPPEHHYFPHEEQRETGPKPTFFTSGINQATQYRPFTPPFAGLSSMKNVSTKLEPAEEEEEVELVYDPVMQCYYDPETMEFYQVNE